jgi:hypothetical protein
VRRSQPRRWHAAATRAYAEVTIVPYVSTEHDLYLGKVVDNGHCVRFLQVCAAVPHTSTWQRGMLVRGSGAVPGTCIATFDQDGKYANATDGSSHAAILLAENSDGLLVSDQWVGHPVAHRTLRYRGGAGDAANDGDRFHIIESATA